MEMELTKGRTALVVIDMQRAFLEDEGSLAKAGIDITGLKAALEPCKRLLASARQAGVPVIHTRYVYRADYADGGILVNYIMPQLREVDSLAAGTPDIEIVDELAPVDGETVNAAVVAWRRPFRAQRRSSCPPASTKLCRGRNSPPT